MLRYLKFLLLICFIALSVRPDICKAQNFVTTYAGNGSKGFNNGATGTATFNSPFGLCIDRHNNIYVADNGNNCIRKINTALGTVETYAGSGVAGWKDGRADTAQFNNPTDVCVDDSGNVYVSDFLNQRIRKISVAGMVSTVAGTGTAGYNDGSALTAQFNYPRGICLDHSRNIYVADSWNHRIRKINTSGVVSTYAGGGAASGVGSTGSLVNSNDTSARFYTPSGLAADQYDNIYVADAYNHRIRKISPALAVTTYAGSGITGNGNGGLMNGSSSAALFNTPTEVFVDTIRNEMYIGDTFNNLVRRIDMTSNTVTTFAGSGTANFTNGIDTLATFNYPRGVVADSSGKKIYVSDFNNNAIRLIAPQANSVHENELIKDVIIFPNPSSGVFDITGLSRLCQIIHLQVFDVMGNKLKDLKPSSVNQLRIDLSPFPKGFYFIKITNIEDIGISVWRKVVKD